MQNIEHTTLVISAQITVMATSNQCLTGRWSVTDGVELAGSFDKASDHVSLPTVTPSARGTVDELAAGYTLTAFGMTCI